MREILFRCWNKFDKKFIYFKEGLYNSDIDFKEGASPSYFFNWEHAEQFTGLLDKNGVKIFNGDKFKPDESIEEVKCIVRWDDEFSKFVVDSYGYNFHIKEGSQEVYDNELSIVDTYDLADMILEYCEIIGNIHE